MTKAKIKIKDVRSKDPNKTIKIVIIKGQLDESNIDEKIQEIYQVLQAVPTNLYLIFNLKKLEYMNSKAIGYFMDILGKVSATGGKVAIADPKPNIMDLLEMVGMSQLISIYDKVKEAKKAINTEG